MSSFFNKARKVLQKYLLRSEFYKELERWQADGGDEANRYTYAHLSKGSLVMDVGGYKGQWSSDIYAKYNCKIMIFEPVHMFATAIEKRFEMNPKIEVFSIALGANQRQETITVDADGSSIYRAGSQTTTIQFVDVEQFFLEHNIKEVDLMKINIEGGEYELLSRLCEAGITTKVKAIQVQFHKVLPDAEIQMYNLQRELAKTHIPTYQYKFVWENWVRKS